MAHRNFDQNGTQFSCHYNISDWFPQDEGNVKEGDAKVDNAEDDDAGKTFSRTGRNKAVKGCIKWEIVDWCPWCS